LFLFRGLSAFGSGQQQELVASYKALELDADLVTSTGGFCTGDDAHRTAYSLHEPICS
jgi:hypothetical protein